MYSLPNNMCVVPGMVLLLSNHPLNPCFGGESGHPAFGPPANLSLHLASSSITPAGYVHSVHLSVLSVCFIYVFVCRKLSPLL